MLDHQSSLKDGGLDCKFPFVALKASSTFQGTIWRGPTWHGVDRRNGDIACGTHWQSLPPRQPGYMREWILQPLLGRSTIGGSAAANSEATAQDLLLSNAGLGTAHSRNPSKGRRRRSDFKHVPGPNLTSSHVDAASSIDDEYPILASGGPRLVPLCLHTFFSSRAAIGLHPSRFHSL